MNNQNFYAYVAGFLDADGSIYVRLKPNKTYLYDFQISPSIVFFQKESGAKYLKIIIKKLKMGYLRFRNDGVVELTIGDRSSIRRLITFVYPHLIFKRKQAKLIIKVLEKSEKIKNAKQFLEVAKLIDKFSDLNYSKKRKIRAQMVGDHLQKKGVLTP